MPGVFVIFHDEYMYIALTQNIHLLPIAAIFAFCLVSDLSSAPVSLDVWGYFLPPQTMTVSVRSAVSLLFSQELQPT